MNISRITALRWAAQFGLPVTLEPAELTEMLNAVEARHNQQDETPRARPDREFPPWFRELEQIAGCAYRAKDIAWFRENGWRKGLSPHKALDLCDENRAPPAGTP